MTIKKQIVIDLQFGTEWQEEVHMTNINMLLKMMGQWINEGSCCPQNCQHKDNKLEYKIIEK